MDSAKSIVAVRRLRTDWLELSAQAESVDQTVTTQPHASLITKNLSDKLPTSNIEMDSMKLPGFTLAHTQRDAS